MTLVAQQHLPAGRGATKSIKAWAPLLIMVSELPQPRSCKALCFFLSKKRQNFHARAMKKRLGMAERLRPLDLFRTWLTDLEIWTIRHHPLY
jgi:hypothetical protein